VFGHRDSFSPRAYTARAVKGVMKQKYVKRFTANVSQPNFFLLDKRETFKIPKTPRKTTLLLKVTVKNALIAIKNR